MSRVRPIPLWLVVPLALAACDSNPATREPNDPPPPTDACQTGPGELPRPPAGSLPCELFPPGFTRASAD